MKLRWSRLATYLLGLEFWFSIGLLLLLIGCNSISESTISPNPLNTAPTLVAAPIATGVITPTTSATLIEVGNILQFEWSEDSETLVYSTLEEEGAQRWLYNVNTLEMEKIDTYQFSPAFPMENNNPVLSPNKVNAITVSQQQNGTFQLHLVSQKYDTEIYKTNCYVAVYWTGDSRYAVIRPILEPGCVDTIQILDSENATITEIVETPLYTSLSWQWMGFSAVNSLILYQSEGNAYLYNIRTGENILVIENNNPYLAWMTARTPEQVLIGHNILDSHGNSVSWIIQQIDTQTKHVTSVNGLDDIIPSARGTGQALVSPNGRWLALTFFSGDRQTYLYIISL